MLHPERLGDTAAIAQSGACHPISNAGVAAVMHPRITAGVGGDDALTNVAAELGQVSQQQLVTARICGLPCRVTSAVAREGEQSVEGSAVAIDRHLPGTRALDADQQMDTVIVGFELTDAAPFIVSLGHFLSPPG